MADPKAKVGPTCKEAIQKWQAKTKEDPQSATKVSLIAMFLRKMEPALNTLVNCEHLSLSTNMIDKIAPLPSLKRLKILTLGRNNIRKIEKLEDLAGSLEQLWLSYNAIEKLDGLSSLRHLSVLFISNNKIKSFDELLKLKDLPKLSELLLTGNPMYDNLSRQEARAEVLRRLPKLKKLDGTLVSEAEVEAALNPESLEVA